LQRPFPDSFYDMVQWGHLLERSDNDFVATSLYSTLMDNAFVSLRNAADNLESIADQITWHLDDGVYFDPGWFPW
jgi:hypothetical protein